MSFTMSARTAYGIAVNSELQGAAYAYTVARRARTAAEASAAADRIDDAIEVARSRRIDPGAIDAAAWLSEYARDRAVALTLAEGEDE